MKERRSKKILWCFLISLLIHALLLLLISRKPSESKPQELQALDVELLETKKRLADIAKPKEEKRPEKADFMSTQTERFFSRHNGSGGDFYGIRQNG